MPHWVKPAYDVPIAYRKALPNSNDDESDRIIYDNKSGLLPATYAVRYQY